MRDLVDGFKELVIFVGSILLLFLGWVFAGGFTPFDFLVLVAVGVHYVWTFKLGRNKASTTKNMVQYSDDKDDPIVIRR